MISDAALTLRPVEHVSGLKPFAGKKPVPQQFVDFKLGWKTSKSVVSMLETRAGFTYSLSNPRKKAVNLGRW